MAALGEMWLGSGKNYNNLIMITLGTGVGGGIIINGKPLIGSNGAGGEIGHLKVITTKINTVVVKVKVVLNNMLPQEEL